MAFTTPLTWYTGQIVTAADLNQQIRDNLEAIRSEDLLFETSVPAWVSSGKTIGTVLASPPAIGGTAPAAGSFSTLSVATDLTVGDDLAVTGDTTLTGSTTIHGSINANEVVNFNKGTAILSIPTPTAPAGGSVNFYNFNNNLYAQWSTGAVFPVGPLAYWYCKVRKTGTQSLTNGIAALINFDDESFDSYAMHSNVTNNTRITVPASGIWEITVEVSFASSATGQRGYVLLANGGECGRNIIGAGATGTTTVVGTHKWDAAAGVYFEVQGYQTSGGALNVLNSPQTYFTVRWLGAY